VVRRAHFVAFAVALILGPRLAGAADPPGRYQGVFGSANYLISVPPDWNGGLVMFAHGYEAKGPVSAPRAAVRSTHT